MLLSKIPAKQGIIAEGEAMLYSGDIIPDL
jgi:hypothetical protein